MLPSLLFTAVLFVVLSLGVGWPMVARANLTPPEKLAAGITLSFVTMFLVGWVIYIATLPWTVVWLLPAVALGGLAFRWAEFCAVLRDPVVRALIGAQAIVTLWCIGWLATVVSYSGAGWAGDWYEHWERSRFFLEHGPLDVKFIGQYPLTARPPLANIITAVLLRITRVDFAHYQLVSTLLASVAFLPAALLAARFRAAAGTTRVIALFTALILVNPLFVQNATFAWTKLPATFFVLAGLYFFLRARDSDAPAAATRLCATALAAGLLAHYSAGPYVVVLAAAWLIEGWPRRRDAAWWRATAGMALIGALILGLWFGWSLATYGGHGTFLTNSSVTSRDVRQGNQFVKITLNIFDTFVPHFLRPLDTSLIDQSSAWGRLRDWFFQAYQINLLFAFGSLAWLALLREVLRARRTAANSARRFWALFIVGAILLGIGTHGARDHWGLAHICMQSLVILGLAFLAARWSELGRGWRLALCAGALVDFMAGIALHFAVQSFSLDAWLAPQLTAAETFMSYPQAALMNLQGKFEHHLVFFGDVLGIPFGPLLVVMAGVAVFVGFRARLARGRLNPAS